MAVRTVLDVVVNKITKAEYDAYVADGTITQEEIENQVWFFTDDQFVSAEQIAKLAGIAEGAEVNVIDEIKVNGVAQTAENKVVNIVVPTKVSELTNDSGFLTESDLPTCETLGAIPNTEKGAANGVAQLGADGKVPAAQLPTAIKAVKVNGEALTPDENDAVDVTVPTCKTRIWS